MHSPDCGASLLDPGLRRDDEQGVHRCALPRVLWEGRWVQSHLLGSHGRRLSAQGLSL